MRLNHEKIDVFNDHFALLEFKKHFIIQTLLSTLKHR